MRAMRRIVAGRNVFSWASDILEGLESLWTKPLAIRGARARRRARVTRPSPAVIYERISSWISISGSDACPLRSDFSCVLVYKRWAKCLCSACRIRGRSHIDRRPAGDANRERTTL